MSQHQTRRSLATLAFSAVAALALVAGVSAPKHEAAAASSYAAAEQETFRSFAVVGTGQDSKSVDRLYWAYFLRTPDPDGLAYWKGRVAAGTPLSVVSDGFAQSTEFRQRYGSLNNSQFVTLVYENVLGRAPDSTGQAHWTNALNNGTSRGQVMVGFSDSEEFKKKTGLVGSGADSRSVERLYWAYFLRTPDPGGLAYWNDRYRSGTSLKDISEGFARSTEFSKTYGTLSNDQFVSLVYENVLGRAPDQEGYGHWTRALASGMTRGEMMVGFSDSEEFKKKAGKTGSGTTTTSTTTSTTSTTLGPGGSSSTTSTTTTTAVPTSSTTTTTTTSTTVAPLPQKPTAPAGSYEFMQTEADGDPLQWPACQPVKVVVNWAGAPAGAQQALTDTLAALTNATKTQWVLEGTTTERAPSMDWSRPFRDEARYGNRYSPVLLSWAETWPADSSTIGVGGFGSITSNGQSTIVTGSVALAPGFVPPTQTLMVSLLLHEFGHVANLGHTSFTDQVMYYSLRDLGQYQYGDKAGLAEVGSWETNCQTAPSVLADGPVVEKWTYGDDSALHDD